MVEAQVMEAPTEATQKPVVALTALDRCDRCGAQAYVRTQHAASELLWCGHHFAKHKAQLEPFVALDNTAAINRGCAAG